MIGPLSRVQDALINAHDQRGNNCNTLEMMFPLLVSKVKVPLWPVWPGLKPVRLRGSVRIHPGRDDIFRKVIEERRRHKDDKDLYQWLKLFANSIYGCFIELNPETLPRRKAARVRVYSGEKPYNTNKRTVVERPGKWYAPYLGALITSGGRLLLGMLERCVEGWGGTYAWTDTDSLAVVSNAEGGTLRHVPGCETRRTLPRLQVQEIIDRFVELNPYDFGGSILRFLDCNYIDSDPEKRFRKELLAFCISAKRYTTYEREGKKIIIIDPKAHGLDICTLQPIPRHSWIPIKISRCGSMKHGNGWLNTGAASRRTVRQHGSNARK